MERQISNEEQFNASIYKLGQLYEEGKDCLHSIMTIDDEDSIKSHHRFFSIIQEMRDLCAVQLQRIHWVNEN